MCKNHPNVEAYRGLMCKECIKESRRKSWHRNKKYYSRKKPKKRIDCAWCNLPFTPDDLHTKTCRDKCKKLYKNKKHRERDKEKGYTESIRKRKVALTKKFSGNPRPYSPQDEKTVLRDDITLLEICFLLKRPYESVRNKRYKLKKAIKQKEKDEIILQ